MANGLNQSPGNIWIPSTPLAGKSSAKSPPVTLTMSTLP